MLLVIVFMGLGPVIVLVWRSHSDTLHSVGRLWTRYRPVTETSYYTTHNTQNRQASMYPEGFETVNPASEWPQTHILDCTATGISVTINQPPLMA